MNEINLGTTIKKHRNAKNLTQKYLANYLGVSYQTVSKWETSISRPDLETIKKMCELFEISIEDFLNESDPKNRRKFLKFLRKVLSFVWKHIIKILFIIAFVLLLIYFISNFNSVKIYSIKNDGNEIFIENGMFLESKYKNVLVLNNIKILDTSFKPEEIYVKLYTIVNGNEFIIFENNNLDSIMIEELYGYSDIFNEQSIAGIKKGMYLKINVFDENNEEHTYETKIDILQKFSNIQLAYFKKNLNEINSDENFNFTLKELTLINQGFQKQENETYLKNSKLMATTVDLEHQCVVFEKNTNNQKVYYKIEYNKKSLSTIIYDSKDVTLVRYKYDYENNKLQCIKGNCDSYQEDLQYVLAELDKLK